MEMCVVKVANALDTSFAALISAENDWAKAAGRRRSTGAADNEGVASAAALAAAAVDGGGAPSGGQRVSNGGDRRGIIEGADRRRMSAGGGAEVCGRDGGGGGLGEEGGAWGWEWGRLGVRGLRLQAVCAQWRGGDIRANIRATNITTFRTATSFEYDASSCL